MHVVVEQSELLSGLQTVQRTSASRSPIEVLSGILFEAKEGGLELSATDLETSVRANVPARVEGEGALVLPARVVVELVRRAPQGEIELRAQGEGGAEFRFGSSRFSIHGYPAERFPEVPRALPEGRAEIAAHVLRDAIQSTAFAASANDLRAVLTGIQLRWAGGRLHAVATDGFRVAHFEAEAEGLGEDPVEVVVPSRAALELARLFGSAEASLGLAVAGDHLLAQDGRVLFQSALVAGAYPAVLDLLPKAYPTVARLPLLEFTAALERVALVAGSGERTSGVRLRFEAGQVEISARSADVGEAREVVAATVAGGPLQIAFNARFLLDGLRHLSGEEAEVQFSGPEGAARAKADDPRFSYWVLPLRQLPGDAG